MRQNIAGNKTKHKVKIKMKKLKEILKTTEQVRESPPKNIHKNTAKKRIHNINKINYI